MNESSKIISHFVFKQNVIIFVATKKYYEL